MIAIRREKYLLLLSHDPCEIFRFFNVNQMHGLYYNDCIKHTNNDKQAYIAGWCNYVPKSNGNYNNDDLFYVFLNLTRCATDIEAIRTIFHELMHMSLNLFKYSEENEEDIISWADYETNEIYYIIQKHKNHDKDSY